jgi:hypothetical protein
VEHIAKPVNRLLTGHVKDVKSVLIQVKGISTEPNAKSNYVVLKITNLIPVLIALN